MVEGDLDMGDTSDIVNLRDPTNAKDAVNKQWVESNFASTIPSGKYVVKGSTVGMGLSWNSIC